MNKTVNINIGGLFFHIDEDAYQKLSYYFEAIKRSLSNSSGQDEIMKDIEMRVAELLIEKQKSEQQVVNSKDVDEVIAVMGQPEDYRIDDEVPPTPPTPPTPSQSYYAQKKKLYRDGDRGLIGGVATGLGHYFGLDAVIFKIIFVLLTIFGGSGILIYLILWIAIPKAVTTTEKLEMNGEPVNISTIEKKVKEEYEYISNKLKDVDFDKIGNRVRTSGIGEAIIKAFTIFAKLLGGFIVLISSISIVGLLIGLLTLGTTSITETPKLRYINTLNYAEAPLWLVGILFFLAFGIPLFYFLLLGLKLLLTKLKPINNIARYSSLAIWIFALIGLIIFGVKQSLEKAYDGKNITKKTIQIKPTDTLKIKFVGNDFFSKDISQHIDFAFTQDSLKNEVIYSNKISFEIKSTDKSQPYLQIEKLAEGKSFEGANDRAEKIKYSYKVVGNQLLLDNYLLSDIGSKYRGQKVKLYLYLPEGTFFSADESVDEFDETDMDSDLDFSSENHTYKIKDSQVICLNCQDEDDSIKSVSVKINGEEIIKNETEKNIHKGKLTIGKDGIIIKTE